MSKSRILTALLLTASSSLALTGRVDAMSLPWDRQTELEQVLAPQGPQARSQEMAALQRSLAARAVERGLRSELVVDLDAADRKAIDRPGDPGGRYLVGVSREIGADVVFPGGPIGPKVRTLTLGAVRGDAGGALVWSAALRAPGATALRARLSELDLPAGAELYVYNEAGQAFGPYTGRGPLGDGELFTHTVAGDRLLLQLRVPAGAPKAPTLRVAELGVMGQRFVIPRYGPRGAFPADDPDASTKASNLCSYNVDCIENAACASTHSAVNAAKDAIATMLFQSGRNYYICTGGLIADTDASSVIPYFLTAHHCISRGREAASLETYFDYTTTCNSPNCTQPYNNTGETVGATIMATNSSSDYTLLRLSSTPTTPDGNAAYLGWSTTPVANTNGVALYRISHPAGAPQAYSEQVVDTSKGTCQSLPRGNFIYSRDTFGATEGGSSGSPVVNGAGQVVGQLYGACGTNVGDSCDAGSNATVDGAFAAYFSAVEPFLDPGTGGPTCQPVGSSCSSNADCCSNSCKGKPGAKVCK